MQRQLAPRIERYRKTAIDPAYAATLLPLQTAIDSIRNPQVKDAVYAQAHAMADRLGYIEGDLSLGLAGVGDPKSATRLLDNSVVALQQQLMSARRYGNESQILDAEVSLGRLRETLDWTRVRQGVFGD